MEKSWLSNSWFERNLIPTNQLNCNIFRIFKSHKFNSLQTFISSVKSYLRQILLRAFCGLCVNLGRSFAQLQMVAISPLNLIATDKFYYSLFLMSSDYEYKMKLR